MSRIVAATTLSLLCALATVGCGKKQASTGLEDAFRANIKVSDVGEDGMRLQEVDLDRNGTTNIFNYTMQRADGRTVVLRKEMDLDGNGKPDLVTWFNEQGDIEREEMDSDYDGLFDWTDHYQQGARMMSEYDTDGDARPDVFKYYLRNPDNTTRLDREERDTNADGKIDYWAKYAEDGKLIRAGKDTDFDGKVDEREQ